MRYTVRHRFDGHGWISQFAEPDIATFGRTLASAQAHARSLLSVYLEVDDLPAAGIEIINEVQLPAGIDIEIDALKRRRAEADRLREEVATATRRAAAALRAAGLSTRDVGELIGVSGTRVGQLDHPPSGPRPKRRVVAGAPTARVVGAEPTVIRG